MATRRNWTTVRRLLEHDFLCASLQGRVSYFATRYRRAHDQIGRVCILVDGNEVLNMPYQVENEIYSEAHRRLDEYDASARETIEEIQRKYQYNGRFYPGDFGAALDEYFSSSIADSLYSDNLLVRLLAVLDRRTGKRTLAQLNSNIDAVPEWLQYFYMLRFDSEGI